MPRYFAFLRAINVGGHIVKMDRLREIFTSLGFSNVETFIASGNVIFDTRSKNTKSLETKIEKELRAALGYDVATFIRTEAELIEIANHEPFSKARLATAHTLNIAFLGQTLTAESTQKLMALKTEVDDLHVRGREIYWLAQKKQSESTISNVAFNKALGMPTTVRGANTVKQMTAKYIGAKR